MDWLSPTLDLTTWYMESRAEIQNTSNTAIFSPSTAGSFYQFWQVPTSEVWVLLGIGFQWTAASTTAPGTYTPCRVRNNDLLSRMPLGPPITPLANELPLIGMDYSIRGLVIRPTVQIGLHYGGGGTLSGSPTVNGMIRFVRCNI
jgi:hypothetical protein